MSRKKGSHLSEEHKQKIGDAGRGKKKPPFTEEHTQKLSEAHKGEKNYWYGKKSPMYGKCHTDETRKKISLASLGRHHSEETCKKISISQIGKNHSHIQPPRSEETKRILSDANKGKKHPQWKGGYEKAQARKEEKRRGFGFIPLNDNFIGAEGHHLDKELVLYIPKELHRSVYHNQFTGQGMEEINNLACEYVYGIDTSDRRREYE